MQDIDLGNYIQQARKSGMGDNKIREGLLQAGWPVSSVEEAIIRAPTVNIPEFKPRAMMSKSLASMFVVTAVTVVGYFGGAYYMSKFQSFPLWPFEVSVPVVTFTPRPVGEARSEGAARPVSSDWQTYRNDEYGFEFKYPDSTDISDLLNDNPPGLSLKTSDKSYLSIMPKGEFDYGIDPSSTYKDVIMNIGGYSANKEEYTDDSGKLYLIRIGFDPKLDKYPSFRFDYRLSSNTSKELFDQIISTFKFTK